MLTVSAFNLWRDIMCYVECTLKGVLLYHLYGMDLLTIRKAKGTWETGIRKALSWYPRRLISSSVTPNVAVNGDRLRQVLNTFEFILKFSLFLDWGRDKKSV